MVLPLSIIILAAFSFKTRAFKNNVDVYDGSTITVVIDAGHGGKDVGASSAKASIAEKDLALAISKKIKNAVYSVIKIFTFYGIDSLI